MIAVADKLQSRLTMQMSKLSTNTRSNRREDETALTLNLGSKTALLTTHFLLADQTTALVDNFMKISTSSSRHYSSAVGLLDY